MEKINIAELLRDCPKDMELDCTMYEDVYFNYVDNLNIIHCYIQHKTCRSSITFNRHGTPNMDIKSKCVIFPKGKTTWEGFVPPFEFKDGDVVATNSGAWIGITTGGNAHSPIPTYCVIKGDGTFAAYLDTKPTWCFSRFATEQEKEKLFKAIKEKGYRWNTKTKTLEKSFEPEFNVGDWIIRNNKYTGIPVKVVEFNGYYSCELNGEVVNLTRNDVHNNFHLWTIDDAKDGDVLFHVDSASSGIFIFKEIVQRGTSQKVICYCDYDSEDGFCLGENHTCCWIDSKILHPATKEQCDLLFQRMKKADYKWNPETKTLKKIVKPEFKVGDKITNGNTSIIIGYIDDEYYYEIGRNIATRLSIENQDEWKLVPDKFDVTTLKPFDKVLVRQNVTGKWGIDFFGSYNEGYYHATGGCTYRYCIPYKGNEHLLDKRNDCDNFYKTWE